MILFDEAESKYYKLLAYLLESGSALTHGEIADMIEQYCPGETDFEVTESLFSAKEGEEMIYMKDNDGLVPVMEGTFPVRNSRIENEAAKSLAGSLYVNHFLSPEIIEKLKAATKSITMDWDPNDITIKNIFAGGASSVTGSYNSELSLIAKAIREQKGICYDYDRPGRVHREKSIVFPVKIEFSLVNDRFRICGYFEDEDRFVKMNLDSMHDIKIIDKSASIDLMERYTEFIKRETKTVILDVEPVGHVIERCFRVFSYYDRKARYDKAENKYRLEISYFRADENEIIKNILSLGSYVVVLEPRTIQKEVYRRIKTASELYG